MSNPTPPEQGLACSRPVWRPSHCGFGSTGRRGRSGRRISQFASGRSGGRCRRARMPSEPNEARRPAAITSSPTPAQERTTSDRPSGGASFFRSTPRSGGAVASLAVGLRARRVRPSRGQSRVASCLRQRVEPPCCQRRAKAAPAPWRGRRKRLAPLLGTFCLTELSLRPGTQLVRVLRPTTRVDLSWLPALGAGLLSLRPSRSPDE